MRILLSFILSFTILAGKLLAFDNQPLPPGPAPVLNFPLQQVAEHGEPYSESKIRRVEIVFILAAPFVLLAHAAMVGIIAYAGTSDRSAGVNVSNEALAFAGLSSLVTTIAITYYDYRQNWPDESAEEKKEAVHLLSYRYRF